MNSFIKLYELLARAVAVFAMAVMIPATVATITNTSIATQAEAAVVRSISVRGNQRVDAETIRSYLTITPGASFTSFDTDESLRQLFATGLFSDVRIAQRGSTLVVEVEENPVVNLVRFIGNDKVKDEQLQSIVQLQSLSIFSQEKLDSDVERVREAVRRSGRSAAQVTANVEQLENNRVNIVFNINEGGRTKIAEINFVGNNAFGDRRLTEVISHNESNFLSWLKRDDIYDADRLRADEERLRRFYFNRGYADFRSISAVADLNVESNSYTITFTVDEGERYRFGEVAIDNALTVVDDSILQDSLEIASGDVYSARKIEKTLVAMTEAIAASGYPFAEVTPRGDRDFDNRTVNITFFIDEGPRTYIERIEVVGNTRSRGYVIRREFDVAEGDAYNRVLVNRAKRRLDALGFFETVRITTRPGSAPDRVIVVVTVKDKPTGEFAFGGGFSSTNGAVGEISIEEKNFLGRGQYLKISGGFGEDTQKYELSFTEPYFLGQRIAAGFDISRETNEPDSDDGVLISSEVTIGRLRAQAPITDYFSATVNYTYKHEEFNNNSGAIISAVSQQAIDESPYTTSSLGYGFIYADIDNFSNPREGIYATFNQDFAGVGGDAAFVKTTAKATAYYLASEDADIVLVGSIAAGNVTGYGSDTLRLTDNFFQGGETIRGFKTRGFGPRDLSTNESLGGDTYFNATAEVQFPLPLVSRSFGLRGAVFADAGTLYGNDFNGALTGTPAQQAATLASFNDQQIRASVGASIIWESPFGPLRMDFSHVLAKADYDRTEFFRFGVRTKF